ncbi:hypothetical protein Q4543_02615 [Salipiger sp. 1_MG-2023]|uniref:hypothetical protein n=1 Tax=Salipiger sp. 1_MG-2023 TaxID=3062665 RepID=UPI0026E48DC4|nr:hypothetical protein [Salipiger sp. 1_MG-2023]MDO6584400.1 hypothetical protein [Salipiger sp. 1_MG-2023]
MSVTALPQDARDVLEMPAADVPDIISALVHRREFSALMRQIHHDLQSADPTRQSSGARALRKLGFPL